jgi:outer membrane protein assembly factor BamE
MTLATRALLAAALALGACAPRDVALPQITQPYRIVIQQGNYISPEMVAQLKPGMSKEQVRFALGTPLLTDIFHSDRWDYVYYRELPGGKREQRNLSVIFEGGKLARVIGDLALGEAPAAPAKPAAVAKPATEKPKPVAAPADKAKQGAEPVAGSAAPQAGKQGEGQNWGTAGDARAAPQGAPQATRAPSAPAEAPKTDAAPEQKPERGFFGRMLEKIGL